MLIGIPGGMVPDEIKNFDGNFLRHGLNAIIKLGLTNNHYLQSELRFTLNKPRLNVVWPERSNFTATELGRSFAEREQGELP